ncbi:MAG: amino acid adenylation domain-containing protein, partial [Halanaerobiales bacterium]|nr:amino acid adenylation domain-containing protein [Halanaerobiales bacterium]
MLRTVFRWEKTSKPMQIILKRHQLPIRFYDFSSLISWEKDIRIKEIKEQERNEKIDIRTEPLRVTLILLNKEEFMMIISNHHILFDGWSSGVILKELFQTYDTLSEGLQVEKRTKNSFKEYIKWLQNQDQTEQRHYWMEYLAGFESKTLFLGSLDINKGQLETNRYEFKLNKSLSSRITDLTTENHITTASIIYTVWGILLQRYNNTKDVVFGTTVSGRSADIKGLEDMVGLFINTVPLRVMSDSKKSAISLLKEIDHTLKERTKYENVSLVDIKSYSQIKSDENIFDSIVVIENYPLDRQLSKDINKLKVVFHSIEESTHFDLNLAVEIDDQITMQLIYNTSMFDMQRIQILAKHFTNLLTSILENSQRKLVEIELLTVEEKNTLLVQWNNTKLSYPKDKNVCRLIEEWAMKTPEVIAVKYMNDEISFDQLNRRANQLARTLRKNGITINQPVGIMAERSIELIVGILGILKAGGAYLPINPAYPEERVMYMLEDSSASVLLTHEHLINTFSFNCQVIALEAQSLNMETDSNVDLLNLEINQETIAYIIFTSGTTGKAKGVMIPHRALNNFLFNLYQNFEGDVGTGDCCLSLTNIAFDVSVSEIFMPLVFGATLILFNNETIPDIMKLARTIIDDEITFAYIPPTLLKEVNEHLRHEQIKLNKMLVGVEPIQDYILENYLALHQNMQIINGYGPTETTICATFYKYGQRQPIGKNVPIGKPLANTQIYILDQNYNLVPQGAVGEIYIAGDGLAVGYLNKAELTAERFLPNPFMPGTRMYKTGDLVQWLPDGNIKFLGRVDHQVKIRGFRVELGEVQSQLLNYEPLNDVIVIDRIDQNGVKYLCAYVTSNQKVTIRELKEYLSRFLPEYMIPTYFIQLDQLPLTPNGKVDRNALPAPDGTIVTGAVYEAPRNETEEILAKIWKEVLGINEVGINDNYFDLGGHSLKATTLVSRIHRELEVAIPLNEIFKQPTIKGISEYIQNVTRTVYEPIKQVEVKEYYEASSAQKRMYLLQQFEKNSLAYNMPGVLDIYGELDLVKVKKACDELIQRHETLRTSFEIVNEQIVQRVHEKVEFMLEFVEQTEQTPEGVIAEFVRPFDLSKAPLMKVKVLRFEDSHYMIMFDMHHIISDGTSMAILIKEFASLYEGKELEKLTIQYTDFTAWQNHLLQSELMKKQEEYWMSQFSSELPVLNLPTDYPRPMVHNFEGDSVKFTLDQQLTASLKKIARETGSTMYMVLLSGINIWLSKYSAEEDIIVGTAIAGRQHVDLEKMIGMFVNTLAIRNQPFGCKTYVDFLKEVRKNALKAYENQDYQFEELVEKLDLARNLSRNPLFDVIFTMQNMEKAEYNLPNLTIRPIEYCNRVAKMDLTILASEGDDEISIDVDYRTALFKMETISRMFSHLKNILKAIATNPMVKLSAVQMTTEEERELILYEFNNTYSEFPKDRTIQELFTEQVVLNPNKVAVVFGNKKLTYKELNEKANSLAGLLREKGVKEDTLVGIFSKRSLEMIIGIIAILKAGGAYLPIDPEYPKDRIKLMLEDCAVDILLTQGEPEKWSGTDYNLIDLLDKTNYSREISGLPITSTPASLAYVIYTSGSTGKPKGVMIENKNVVRLVKNTNYIKFTRKDKILQTGTLAFDASTFEIWGALLNGLELHFGVKDLIVRTEEMEKYIVKNQISILWLTAPLFNVMAEERPEMFKTLKYLLSGGDVLLPKFVYKVKQVCKNLKIVNGYGPTENTTFSTYFLVDKDDLANIPIGKPISNSTAYIVDQYNRLTPIGVYGELSVGGDGLARGYVNNPKLTAQKFVENPFILRELMYRTGDLARWLSDGNIEFLGRADHQVKIRGFRIEPGEIENILLKSELVKETVVVDGKDDDANKYLTAYLVTDREISVGEIREYLANYLPDYMIPSYFVQLERMPLNKNGKVDYKALPKPEGNIIVSTEYESPRNECEEKLLEMWKEVLKVEHLGINDSFFELGGHSLKAMILTAKIQKEFNVEVTLSQIFKSPTIKEMAKLIHRATRTTYIAIEKVSEQEYYGASSAQKRMYMLQQFDLQSTGYNIPIVLKVEGDFHFIKAEKAFSDLINRHETLRTSFERVEDQIVQRVHQAVDFTVERIDNGERSINELVREFVRPFDLRKALLIRIGISTLSPVQHILMLDMHHIISDGTSVTILINEFISLYQGQELLELKIQYKDYAGWQNLRVKSDELKKQKEYWIHQFSGAIPVLNLPTDYPRPAVQSLEGASLTFRLEQELTRYLHQLARETDSTVFMVLLAGVNILLSKYSGQEEIIIGTPVAGRPHADLQKIIGMFVNTLAMRNYPAGNKTYAEFLNEVRNHALDAYENQDFQFEELVELLNLRRDLSRTPLFDVMFVMQNMGWGELDTTDLKFTPYTYENHSSKFDISISASVLDDEIILDIDYCTKLFKRETIVRMASHYKMILKAIIANPNMMLNQIDMLTVEEKEKILGDFNDTCANYQRDKTLIEIFEEKVDMFPNHVALVYEDHQLTYREVNERANQIAKILRANGVRADHIVGIMVERSPEMVIGILGILKAGGAYLPITPEYPKDRIQYMLNDSRAAILLTQNKYISMNEFAGEIIDLNDSQVCQRDSENLSIITTSRNLVYVIYTSGSTGQPKGITVEHQSVVNILTNLENDYPLTENGTYLLKTTFTFDVSVAELFGWYLGNGRLAILSSGGEKDVATILDAIERYNVTHINFVPSMLNIFLDGMREEDLTKIQSLRYVFVAGEEFPRELAKRCYEKLKNANVENIYGPTETTIYVTRYSLRHLEDEHIVPIGKPLNNVKANIVNQYGQLLPVGIDGELCIAGECLVRGYFNREELNAEKFVENPFAPGEKMYRTGDLVKWLPDGNIAFLGRIDHQVKIRG